MYVGRRLVTDLDDVICWLIADEPEAPCAISSTSLACCDAEHSDGPISDDLNKEAKPDACAGYVPWGLSIPFDTGLFQSLVPKDRSFSMFPRPATPAAPAPVLPERKDMLPDSEHGRLLIDLGVIADPRDLLALPKPVAPIYFDGSRLPGRIMF